MSFSRRSLFASVASLALFATIVSPGLALAASDEVRLGLTPVGQSSSFFDLTMRPGETQRLAVDIGNFGQARLAARTYAADVFTIVDGGFGARLRGEPTTGTTRWLDYPTDVLDLATGDTVRRTFSLAVPADAAPGEYITSLVIENDQPLVGDGAVAVNQIVRQAVAVVVTVPGRRSASLAIGEASQTPVGGGAVVAIAIQNTGDVRLKPIATMVLSDAAGAELGTIRVAMDSFYAHTTTSIEMPLAASLAPGRYNVDLTLDDAAQGAHARASGIVLIVETPALATPAQGAGSGPAVEIGPAGVAGPALPVWGIALLACLALIVVVGSVAHVRRSQHRGQLLRP